MDFLFVVIKCIQCILVLGVFQLGLFVFKGDFTRQVCLFSVGKICLISLHPLAAFVTVTPEALIK